MSSEEEEEEEEVKDEDQNGDVEEEVEKKMPTTKPKEIQRLKGYEYQATEDLEELASQLEPKYQRYAKWRI